MSFGKDDDDDVAAILLLLGHTSKENEPFLGTNLRIIKAEEDFTVTTALVEKKRKKKVPPRLTKRKYDRERRRERNREWCSNCCVTVYDEEEIVKVFRERDGTYHKCVMIDYIQIDDNMYYDLELIDEQPPGNIMGMVDSTNVYPIDEQQRKRLCKKVRRISK